MRNTTMKNALVGLMGGAVLVMAGCATEETPSTTLLVDKVNVPSTPTAISASNQNTVVAETADSVDGALAVGTAPLGASLQNQTASRFSLYDFARGSVLDAVGQGLVQAQNLPAALAVTQSLPCDSGSMNLTLNLSNPLSTTLQPGDSFSVHFDNCVDNQAGATSNGGMSATMVSGSLVAGCDETATCPDFSLTMSFNDLQITEMGETALIDGGFNLAYASATTTNTVSGNDIYIYSSTGQGVHMSNFNIISAMSGNTETATVSSTLASTRMNGSVQIQTTTPFVTANVDTDNYPSSGVMVITGANSVLTVTALNATSAQLELDADNDGTVDQTATVLWTDIDAAN